MDFHALGRRELQALCKKNKIKANMTNLAMADSLQSIQKVEDVNLIIFNHQKKNQLNQKQQQEINGVPLIEIPDTPMANTSVMARKEGNVDSIIGGDELIAFKHVAEQELPQPESGNWSKIDDENKKDMETSGDRLLDVGLKGLTLSCCSGSSKLTRVPPESETHSVDISAFALGVKGEEEKKMEEFGDKSLQKIPPCFVGRIFEAKEVEIDDDERGKSSMNPTNDDDEEEEEEESDKIPTKEEEESSKIPTNEEEEKESDKIPIKEEEGEEEEEDESSKIPTNKEEEVESDNIPTKEEEGKEEESSKIPTNKEEEVESDNIPTKEEEGKEEESSKIPTNKEEEVESDNIPTKEEEGKEEESSKIPTNKEEEVESDNIPTKEEEGKDEEESSKIPTNEEEEESDNIPTKEEEGKDEEESSKIPTNEEEEESDNIPTKEEDAKQEEESSKIVSSSSSFRASKIELTTSSSSQMTSKENPNIIKESDDHQQIVVIELSPEVIPSVVEKESSKNPITALEEDSNVIIPNPPDIVTELKKKTQNPAKMVKLKDMSLRQLRYLYKKKVISTTTNTIAANAEVAGKMSLRQLKTCYKNILSYQRKHCKPQSQNHFYFRSEITRFM